MIIGATQNGLRAKGIILLAPDRFFDLLMEEFLEEFILSIQAQSASLYLENFSEQQLSDVAAFYKSESGQAFVLATPTMMMAAAQMGRQAGQKDGANAGRRLASRIRSKRLIEIDDPDILSR
ncbi:MAG: hypothetical protein ACI8Q6_001846 [Granulosicoccus sp.]